jgi:hypothetical protein
MDGRSERIRVLLPNGTEIWAEPRRPVQEVGAQRIGVEGPPRAQTLLRRRVPGVRRFLAALLALA